MDVPAAVAMRCAGCGTDLAAGLLACPNCRQLVHADALADLKREADAAAAAGEIARELAAWRQALRALPPQSRQSFAIAARIEELLRENPPTPASPEPPKTGVWKWTGGLGTLGLLLLGKGKLLLLGLTKASTFLSMFVSFGVYWAAWGMWFAAGFVLSIYVHEMGHVAAMKYFGLEATAPMFIPGVGAFIRLQGRELKPYENARIGLAGPLWGLAAAVAALSVGAFGGGPMWAAIAHVGAWINLFNLLPVWQLDGNRAFSALSKPQRWWWH